MRRFLHECWPVAAVGAFVAVLVLQIPRKALFFTPVEVPLVEPSASFVWFDKSTYASVVRKARMSWQERGAVGLSLESRVNALDLAERHDLPAALPLPAAFAVGKLKTETTEPPTPLRPSSLADSRPLVPVAAPPDDAAAQRRLLADLLALPESLQENQKETKP